MKRASRYFLFWPLILCALSFSYAFASQPDVSLTSFLELSGITDGDDNCYATDTFIQAPTSTEDKIIATDVVESYEEISNDSTGEKFQLEVSPFYRPIDIPLKILRQLNRKQSLIRNSNFYF